MSIDSSYSDPSSKPLRPSNPDQLEPDTLLSKSYVISTKNPWSSFFESVSQSNLEEIRTHLDRGQSPRSTNCHGDTPLHIASKSGPLDIVKLLLEYGANPNSINSAGLTPLHYATRYDQIEIVKFLLNNGADPNIPDHEKGKTCLHLAAENRSKEIYEILVKCNADASIQDKLGNFPVYRMSTHQSIRFDDEFKSPCACDSCNLF